MGRSAPRLGEEIRKLLFDGTVIPAHPLAIDSSRKLDVRHQRALTRYYVEAGAGGIAVGVHTTQFGIRERGLYGPVLSLAMDTVSDLRARSSMIKVAGVSGPPEQAVREAQLAADLGYDLALVIPQGSRTEGELLEKVRLVSAVIPVFGFYLQPAVGGMPLSFDFWRDLADIEGVDAIKIAPFDRYRTVDVMRGVLMSRRGSAGEIALYTGNDDNIVADLLTSLSVAVGGKRRGVRIVGGLLGQWAVWTRHAVNTLALIKRAARDGLGRTDLRSLSDEAGELTEANGVIFDVRHGFKGSIGGIGEVLRRQRLVANNKTLDPRDGLSSGQSREIGEMLRRYPSLHAEDDVLIRQRLDEWLA